MKSINYFYCINRRFQPDNELVVSAREGKTPNFIDLSSNQKISPCCLYKMFRGEKSDSLVCRQFLCALNIYLSDDRQLSRDALTGFLQNLLMQVLSKSNHKVSLDFSITCELVKNLSLHNIIFEKKENQKLELKKDKVLDENKVFFEENLDQASLTE